MALLRKRFKLYGDPYDAYLFDYINGTKYPTAVQWNELSRFLSPIKCFSRDKRRLPEGCVLYRATDYQPVVDAKIGDTIEFNRFYSWTDRLKVARDIVESHGGGIVLRLLNFDGDGLDLRRVNAVQSEILLPPNVYMVAKIDRDIMDLIPADIR